MPIRDKIQNDFFRVAQQQNVSGVIGGGQLGEFDYEMQLTARLGTVLRLHCLVTIIKALHTKALLLPPILSPAGVLDNYDAVGPFLLAAFIPLEHFSYWTFGKGRRLIFREDGLLVCCCHCND